MNEPEFHELLELLDRYFTEAEPDDPAGNIRLIKRLTGMQFPDQIGKLLLFAPSFMLQALREMVGEQTRRMLFGGYRSESEMDRQLQAFALALVMTYAHLIQAAGSGGVMALVTALPLWLRQQEDETALSALALSFVARNADPLTRVALKSAVQASAFRDAYEQAYNTATRIALAYLLFEQGQREPFQSAAGPLLARGEERRQLERQLQPGNVHLRGWVLAMLLLEIASQGGSVRPEAGWRRRRQ
ncbi:hypothetical protein [Chloroflexus aggregans]|uniref:Uncharacterized protein n=1 Tax=Chloroflexus aggregans (strain MD-66 / DSM 9485) TaxID=326427 RepID=B8G4Y8_CHLAD|nr:hypothetical protein [Chloroflexus aggregans]ACL23621.1 hypothetical protein Cagg_0692 [Chloroflexus aggregans DSM 9485]